MTNFLTDKRSWTSGCTSQERFDVSVLLGDYCLANMAVDSLQAGLDLRMRYLGQIKQVWLFSLFGKRGLQLRKCYGDYCNSVIIMIKCFKLFVAHVALYNRVVRYGANSKVDV